MFKSEISAPGFIGSLLLIIAIFDMPYGYYMFLRWAITFISGYLSMMIWDKYINLRWLTLLITILFNPFIPIHLDKNLWFPIDLICSVIFIVTIVHDSRVLEKS